MLRKYFIVILLSFGLCNTFFAAEATAPVHSKPMKVTIAVGDKQYDLQFKPVKQVANHATTTQTAEVDLTDLKDIAKLQAELNATWNTVKTWWGRENTNLLILLGGVFITFLIAALIGWIFKRVVIKAFTAKTKTVVDDMLGEAVEPPFKSFILILGIAISAMPILLKFSPPVFNVIIRIILAGMASTVAWGIFRLLKVIDYYLYALSQRTDNNLDDMIVSLIRKTLKVTLVILSIMFIGQSILGLNITTLLAGAGVVGLGIAFAAQDTIANFFGSMMIILDKPFKVGDRVVVSGVDGVVEHVGFRSTRLRTLSGHLVTMPNSKMANEAVENIDARPYVKLVSNLTLVYDTPVEKVERAIEVLHEILDNHEGMDEEKPPLIRFNAFNDWSLNILVIVWYHPGDWLMAQAWNHHNNLKILKRFNAEGIEFAFPTNTTYLAGDPNRQLVINQTK